MAAAAPQRNEPGPVRHRDPQRAFRPAGERADGAAAAEELANQDQGHPRTPPPLRSSTRKASLGRPPRASPPAGRRGCPAVGEG